MKFKNVQMKKIMLKKYHIEQWLLLCTVPDKQQTRWPVLHEYGRQGFVENNA